jgi:hypothetical protein
VTGERNGKEPALGDRIRTERLAELATAATELRRRIESPASFPHPFPQEYTLLAVSRLLDEIAQAGPTPTAAAWQRVVESAVEIARHVQRNRP